jgi:SAM-dependent methyltransferase/alkylhydroperoxidase family enzyme
MATAADWRGVDEGWGRAALDFATLSEPGNCREYLAMHQHLNVHTGDRTLDVACGSGLAIELAAIRGALCAGIDASTRLVDVAKERTPAADIRVGDMHALPWDDGSFDVVTSFRGIWGTTPDALAEVHRVLAPGGRVGITVWGHIKASPGAWALRPFTLAPQPKVENQAAMVALGRPGAGEDLLARYGFADVTRVGIPFAWEFADPAMYARALASTGPAYEAIQAVGEEEFLRYAIDIAQEHVRAGLPLRAEINVVGYLAVKPIQPKPAHPASADTGRKTSFLEPPATLSAEAQALYDEDIEDLGYVMNVSRLWAHQPVAVDGLFALMGDAARAAGLDARQRGILVTACASALGDAYCSLAWGQKLSKTSTVDVAAGVLAGDDELLEPAERALARWARKIARDPNGTDAGDVRSLRDAGFDDAHILALSLFVGLRIAFSSVNDALGAQPDLRLAQSIPAKLREQVTYGRPVERERAD